jgi:hypothetical protein
MSNLHPADRILLGSSLLLLVDSFLPWQRVRGHSLDAWQGGGKWVGVLMGLFAILLVLWSAASAAGMTSGVGDTAIRIGAVLVGATFGSGLLKFLLSAFNHGFLFAWAGLICLLSVAYGGYMRLQEPSAAAAGPPRSTTDPSGPPRHGGFVP